MSGRQVLTEREQHVLAVVARLILSDPGETEDLFPEAADRRALATALRKVEGNSEVATSA